MNEEPMVTIHAYDATSDTIVERKVTRERFEELVKAGVIERKAGMLPDLSTDEDEAD